MKVFVVMSLARQHLGDYCFLRAEKAFANPKRADDFLHELKKNYTDQGGNYHPIQLNTPNGNVTCYCEAGVFELEIEE